MKKIKENIKLIFGILIGIILSGTTAYALTVVSTQISYDNSQSGIEANNVQAAIDKLYEKASSGGGYSPEECVTPTFNLGDYIELVPDSVSYKVPRSLTGYSDQTIKIAGTSSSDGLRLWRVIKKNPCNVEVVSEYASEDGILIKGTIGYANYVGALNEIARQYGNKYVSSARHMGYDGQTEYISDTSAFDGSTNTAPSTTTTPSPTTGTGQEYSGGVAGDTLYLKDYQLVSNVYGNVIANKVGTTKATSYWLASRKLSYTSETYFFFYGRYVYNSGALMNASIRGYNSSNSGWVDGGINRLSVRPILTLKSGITTSGGDGTKDNPYTLS